MHWLVRPEKPGDFNTIDRIHLSAFGQDNEGRLVRALRCFAEFDPELSLVVEFNETVVGHILFSKIHIRAPGRDVPALALAPMAVSPASQRCGAGSALVRKGLDRARELDHERVIVVGHETYYPRFGFVPASRFGIRAPFPVAEAAFMALELRKDALVNCAGVVEYPSAFNEA